MYAVVENNEVVKVLHVLPKAYTFANGDKTGNFDLIDSSIQNQEGFYVVEDDKPQPTSTQRLVLDGYTILPTKVVRNYSVEDIPIEELKERKLSSLRETEAEKTSNNTFTFNQVKFNLTEKSIGNAIQMQSLIGIGVPFPENFTWTTADDEEYPMTEEVFTQFATTMAATKLHMIGVGKFHAEMIKSLTNRESVFNYDTMVGW